MTLNDHADTIIQFVRDHKQWGVPVVFALAFGESIAFVSLVLPFWGMLVALGALLREMQFELTSIASIWIAASVGASLGDWLSYWLGYHYHAQIARIWPLSRHPDLLPRGHAFFEKWGAWAIVLARFSGPFRASVPIVAGAVEMDWIKFQIANWSSAFLWAGVLLLLGDVVGQGIDAIWRLFSG
jgi:membrane protein DedA with SNARE-associated domain